METAVARAPTRALTDEDDVVAAGGVVPVDGVGRPRLVARRPDEQQRPFGALLDDALVAAMHLVPGLHTSEPRVGERRWRLHVVCGDVDTAAVSSAAQCPVPAPSSSTPRGEQATIVFERRVGRHGEPVPPQDLDLEWLVARRSRLCHELRHVVDAPAFRTASFHLGQHREPGMRQPRAARGLSRRQVT